jgi:hypothetical protein
MSMVKGRGGPKACLRSGYDRPQGHWGYGKLRSEGPDDSIFDSDFGYDVDSIYAIIFTHGLRSLLF